MDDGGAPDRGAETSLPKGFGDLESYVSRWVCDSSAQRSEIVAQTPLPQVQGFYDAVLARSGDALSFLEQFPLDRQPQDAARLFKLLLALAQASVVVESQGRIGPRHAEFLGAFDQRAKALR